MSATAITAPSDSTVAGTCGKTLLKYRPKAMAASAIGAAKPAVADSQPAMKPTAGCRVRERKWYSPPERGRAAASSP